MTVSSPVGEETGNPALDRFNKHDRGISAMIKWMGETESPWKRPRRIGTWPKLLPEWKRLTEHCEKEDLKNAIMDG